MKELEGKIALVTGASRGLGRGIAEVLAEKGAAVIVNYRTDAAHAESLCEEIRAKGGTAVPFQADVGKREDTDALFDYIKTGFGRLDILVNNAGTTKAQDIFETSEADWDFILQTNLKSLFLMCKRAMEIMREQKSGRIINISSVSGLMGNPGQANYAASKAGLIGLTKTLAKEYASRGVTCNAVAPGFIETEMTAAMPAPALEAAAGAIPAKRLGRPEDIAAAALFLASDGASYITGEVLKVDGGLYI